jgi:hypothetical protein
MNPAIAAAADSYPFPAYRDAVLADVWIFIAAGLPLEEARRRAFALADKERRGDRDTLSLDELLSDYGDALRAAALPSRPLSASQRCRDGKGQTAREPAAGIEEPDEGTLDYLVSVVRNLVDRNVLEVDPLVCAIDIRGLDGLLRRTVLAVVQSATKAELSEAGISPKVRARAKRWLSDYAPRVRPDLI